MGQNITCNIYLQQAASNLAKKEILSAGKQKLFKCHNLCTRNNLFERRNNNGAKLIFKTGSKSM